MTTLLTALFIVLVLVVGSYGIAVIEQLLASGPRRVGAAFLLPLAAAMMLLRQEDVRLADFLANRFGRVYALQEQLRAA